MKIPWPLEHSKFLCPKERNLKVLESTSRIINDELRGFEILQARVPTRVYGLHQKRKKEKRLRGSEIPEPIILKNYFWSVRHQISINRPCLFELKYIEIESEK